MPKKRPRCCVASAAARKAEAFTAGADDYLVKIPEKVELIARIRYHSRAYATLMQRNAAHEALADTQRQIERDIARASAYVRSLLPAPPAVLFDGAGEDRALPTQNFFIGARRDVVFAESRVPVPGGCVLYVFSDGVFQITMPQGACWSYDLFREDLGRHERTAGDLENCHGGGALEDDYSLLRVSFAP